MNPKIVVIDDERMILDLTAMVLQHRGYEVFTADNARDGYAVIDREQPALALLDYMMPQINGLTAFPVGAVHRRPTGSRAAPEDPDAATADVGLFDVHSPAAIDEDACASPASAKSETKCLENNFHLESCMTELSRGIRVR